MSNKDILLQSKNLFSFVLNKNKKLKNVKIDSIINFDEIYFNDKYQKIIFLKEGTIKSKFENQQLSADIDSNFAFSDYLKLENKFKNNKLKLSLKSKNNSKIKVNGNMSNEKVSINPEILSNLIGLDPKLLSQKQVNVETDNKFKFEINNGKFENYIFNSEINFDKLEINKQIQDILYLKNIKTKFTLKDKLLKVDLKSNYSFFDKKLENESDKNTLNLKLEKKDSKISDVDIFIQSDNNNIKTKELKKYFNFQELDSLVENQLINLNSNLKINAKIDEKFNIEKFSIKSDINLEKLNIIYKSNIIKNYVKNYENRLSIKNPQISFEYSDDLINLELNGKYALKDKDDTFFLKFTGNKSNSELYSLLDLNNSILNLNEIQYFKKKISPLN